MQPDHVSLWRYHVLSKGLNSSVSRRLIPVAQLAFSPVGPGEHHQAGVSAPIAQRSVAGGPALGRVRAAVSGDRRYRRLGLAHSSTARRGARASIHRGPYPATPIRAARAASPTMPEPVVG